MSSLTADLRVIRCNPTDPDPALCQDPTPANIEAIQLYVRDRDPAKAPLVADVTPTWFVVRRLPAAYLSAVIDGIYGVAAQREHAVRAAVHRVEVTGGDVLSVTPRKGASEGTPYLSTEAAHGVALAGNDWVQEIADRFGAETIQELGAVALDLARLPRGRRGPFSPWGGTVASR